MSDNPFVNRLGDAIETAAVRSLSSRRRRTRRVFGAVLVAGLLTTGVALGSTLFGDAERVAAANVNCYENEAMTGASGIVRDERPPVVACAEELALSGPLVACHDGEDNIAVVPTTRSCRELGLLPLPAQFEVARERVLALERDVRALESAESCIAPDDLARRVQELLGRAGWTGWNAVVRDDLSQGPCGHALWLNGDGSRSLSLYPAKRQVVIAGEPE